MVVKYVCSTNQEYIDKTHKMANNRATTCVAVTLYIFNIFRTSVKVYLTDLAHDSMRGSGQGINDYVFLHLFCEICAVTV